MFGMEMGTPNVYLCGGGEFRLNRWMAELISGTCVPLMVMIVGMSRSRGSIYDHSNA